MLNTRVKICGVTSEEDATKAVVYGAAALGFIFHKKSPRYVSPSKARKIIQSLPPFVTTVGVFVDLKEGAVRQITEFTGIRTLQFHGDESPAYCKRFANFKLIKAFRVGDGSHFSNIDRYKVDAYLFDSHSPNAQGGTGTTFDWNLIKGRRFQKPFILSGGLTPENILQAKEMKPFAVDVSSGVEKSPGIKDHRKMRAFIDAVAFESR